MEDNPFRSPAWAGLLPSFSSPPCRVISMVRSITESLFELGLGGVMVGCTDYCTRPARETVRMDKIGGPRDVRIADVLALNPDFIIASQEENQKETVDSLQESGLPVWVIHPRSINQ